MELVEHPRAMSTARAFRNASFVMIWRGNTLFLTSSMIFMPLSLARRRRAECTAGIVPLPGSAIPSTSERQFIELAVNMPEHEPQDGQALFSRSSNWIGVILPVRNWLTASLMLE